MKKRTGNSFMARMTAIAIAAVVVITSTPALVLADEDESNKPNEPEVTIEVVASDESNAEQAVSNANTSTVEAQNADSSENPVSASEVTIKVTNEDGTTGTKTEYFDPAVTAANVETALGNAKDSLDLTKGNIGNITTYTGELQSEDSEGNPTGLLPAASAAAGTASGAIAGVQTLLQPVTDEYGDPVYIPQLDENGNEIKDENGNIVYVQQTKLVAMLPEVGPDGNPIYELDGNNNPIYELDENGEPKLDEKGEPIKKAILKTVDFSEITNQTATGANNAISSAYTANTSNSEEEARNAFLNAGAELDKAEQGLGNTGKAVMDAKAEVEKAETALKAA